MIADFKNVRLKANERRSTPYYVKVRVKTLGTSAPPATTTRTSRSTRSTAAAKNSEASFFSWDVLSVRRRLAAQTFRAGEVLHELPRFSAGRHFEALGALAALPWPTRSFPRNKGALSPSGPAMGRESKARRQAARCVSASGIFAGFSRVRHVASLTLSIMKQRHALLALTGALSAVAAAAAPATAAAGSGSATIVVKRGGPARTVPFTVRQPGEARIKFTAAAPGVSWARAGAESAVVSISVDGHYVTDLVVPSADPTPRSLALGAVRAGHHRLTMRFAADRSATPARRVTLAGTAITTAGDVVLRHAPIVVGRTLPELGGANQNARTDAPLIAWHEEQAAATPGHRIIEYSVVWSNEDGGTDTPALMSRWGRTTDIEWIYRVEVDAAGERVAGSGVYQAANHQTLAFAGKYEADHPILQTCTSNNNMCDAVTPAATMRFFLDTTQTRPADRAREVLMDRNPWTYPITAQEMLREGKIESPPDPDTVAVGDERTYLFLEIKKQTGAATGTGSAPGVSVGIRLESDPAKLYRSDHSVPTSSIARDDPAATTIELPRGTTGDDIASIEAIRQPMGEGDNGAPATVTSINRAFFLDGDYLPQPSFVTWTGSVALTPAQPSAVLWRR
jgi:hypothetical protein